MRIVKSSSNNQIITANGSSIKQDASGNLGIYPTTGGTELAFFDINGNLIFTGAGTPPTTTATGIGSLTAGAGASLIFNIATGKLFGFRVDGTSVFNLTVAGISAYKNIATAGGGVPAIYASYSTTANIAAVTNAINYTPPATAGRYRLTWTVDCTTATTNNFTVVIGYTNATGTAKSQNSGGFDKAGTGLVAGAITNTIGTGNYYGSMMFQIDNSATAITLSTSGTFTTVTYNLAAILEQLA